MFDRRPVFTIIFNWSRARYYDNILSKFKYLSIGIVHNVVDPILNKQTKIEILHMDVLQ